jgi:hypothetical protein
VIGMRMTLSGGRRPACRRRDVRGVAGSGDARSAPPHRCTGKGWVGWLVSGACASGRGACFSAALRGVRSGCTAIFVDQPAEYVDSFDALRRSRVPIG